MACILNHLSERTKFLGPLDWIYPLHKITKLSRLFPPLVTSITDVKNEVYRLNQMNEMVSLYTQEL